MSDPMVVPPQGLVNEMQRIADNIRYSLDRWDHTTPADTRRYLADAARDIERVPSLWALVVDPPALSVPVDQPTGEAK